MSDVLIINKDHSISSVEDALLRLARSASATDLLLNTSTKHAQFGGLTALNQLIVTWAKRNPRSCLRTYVTAASEAKAQIENLAKYDHGLMALLMAVRVSDRAGKVDLGIASVAATRGRLRAMEGVAGATRGAKTFLAVADHTGIFPSSLYDLASSPNPVVRQWAGFRSIASQLLLIATVGPEKQKLTDETIDRFGGVLWELFKNTHDWARNSVSGQPLSRSVRALRVEHYSHLHEKHLEMTSDEPRLSEYLSHPGMMRPGGRSRLVEVSILDSGPGLAARALEKRPSIRSESPATSAVEEYAAVVDCLRTHFSTSADTHRGDGLHQVFMMLDGLHGFLRIRTGRLALSRDFIKDPYRPSQAGEPFLLDWQTGLPSPTATTSVEGMTMTMLFPVAYD